MREREVIAERFELEKLVGSGGMGEVYQARDRASGTAVAVKVLYQRPSANVARFTREAELLSGLHHPAIVRYVAHGTAGSGAPYLAMEWLEGEDLGTRLRRARLTVDESVTLVLRAAEALAAVHARGVIHRDLKPSNLFLVDGDVAKVKLLDFGIARLPDLARVTKSGLFLGTPGYMAPEQARSDGPVDTRADVFALGCVLFECLTGTPAFVGEHFMAILGKILFDETPRISELRPEVSASLDALCARMLAKEPDERPRDGGAAAEALRVCTLSEPPPSEGRACKAALGGGERRTLGVVLISAPTVNELSELDTRPVSLTEEVAVPDPLRRTAQACGGRIERLSDGGVVVTLSGAQVPTDQAAEAARCALALRALCPDRPMALAMGRAERTATRTVGEVIDRAVKILARLPRVHQGIAIDEVTAGLLTARFDVREGELGLSLWEERELTPGARTLLGKPTPCVGRDWELSTLEQWFAEGVDDARARSVLVTAPAGMGKSRIAFELFTRLRRRPDEPAIWIGRGDSLKGPGATFGLLGQALRGALGIESGEAEGVRRDKIKARVAEGIEPGEVRRVAEFLGEIVGAPFPDEDSLPLRAARQDAQLMSEQVRRAFEDFLEAETRARPLLLVLENLQWGDEATLRLLDGALRRLKEQPWMVLGLTRPEVHDLFPNLWLERGRQEIRLRKLPRKASLRLVRQVLGDAVRTETVERLLKRADGNAFYLEELLRATAEDRGDALPETVAAMVEARIEGLEGSARRLLRAASVFGEVFWGGAVLALLGPASASSVDERLADLARLEWITPQSETKFEGEREFIFGHSLVREAAYGMLTEQDRVIGHRLAGEWLEQAGEPSAAVIAEHFDRGGDAPRAIGSYLRAAAQALSGNDLGAVLSHTERALALGASAEVRGELARIRAEAHHWRGDIVEAGRWARAAMEALPMGSSSWYVAVNEAAWAASASGQKEHLTLLADELLEVSSAEEATGSSVAALARTSVQLFFAGVYDRAEALDALIESVADRFSEDPSVSGPVFRARSVRELVNGHLDRNRALTEAAVLAFERAGDLRSACSARNNLASAECRLGAYAEAAAHLRAAVADAERLGLERALTSSRANLGLALGRLGELEEAQALEKEAIATAVARGDRRVEGGARSVLAGLLESAGELEAAEAEARHAVERLEANKPLQVEARARLGEVLRARGKFAEALAEARLALEVIASVSKVEEGEELARLVFAEALSATGEHAAACEAIAEARERLFGRAARIEDVGRRESFLKNVRENARTLALAEEWLGGAREKGG